MTENSPVVSRWGANNLRNAAAADVDAFSLKRRQPRQSQPRRNLHPENTGLFESDPVKLSRTISLFGAASHHFVSRRRPPYPVAGCGRKRRFPVHARGRENA